MALPTTPAAAKSPVLPTTLRRPAFDSAAREVTAGRLVSRSFSVWWSHLFKFAALTLLVFVPMILALAVFGYQVFTARGGGVAPRPGSAAFWIAIAFAYCAALVGGVIQMGGLTYGAVQHLAGRPVRLGSMLAAGFRRALPLIGVGLMVGVLVMLGSLLLVVPGIIVACGLAVAIPAVVAEKIGPNDAISRSWKLTRGHRLSIFAAWFVIGVALVAMNLFMQFGVMVFGTLAPVVGLVAGVLYLLAAPLMTLLPAVAYHDLRAAKEGIATEELVKVFE